MIREEGGGGWPCVWAMHGPGDMFRGVDDRCYNNIYELTMTMINIVKGKP